MPKWNAATEGLVYRMTSGMRRRRNDLFLRKLTPCPTDTVLDLGSEDGSQIASFYPYPEKVVLADIVEAPMKRGVERYGFAGYVLLDPDAPLPMEDRAFDIVYSNSAIEHVTGPDFSDEREFQKTAAAHQRLFADEIRRVGKAYFVQTPNIHFPIESHALLPLVGYLSARRNRQLSRLLKGVWIKQWSGGARLLNRRQMRELFSDASIVSERFLGITKSWIAVKEPTDRAPG